MRQRQICIVTGSRADYGLLYWLMMEIREDKDLHLQVIATGSHLSSAFGSTCREIEADGFKIDRKIPILTLDTTATGITRAMGRGVRGFGAAFERLRPDIIVLLGDRYEILAAAQAAMIARIPIAHLCGGETTEGVIDEAIRHSITKMSQLHFVASRVYAERVRQLGEDPKHIFNFGDPGMEHIRRLRLLSKARLEKELCFKFNAPVFLITYHPVTLIPGNVGEGADAFLRALSHFSDAKMIFTKANADMGGAIINRKIEKFVKQHSDRSILFTSLGSVKYLSAMKYSDVIIGNSSSGIVESPMFKKPTVDIGERQQGRLKASSILSSPANEKKIVGAIQKALSPEFQRSLSRTVPLYGVGNTAFRIKEQLKKQPLAGILVKHFFDLPCKGGRL